MTRRMLINAQRPEELRVAIVAGEKLDEYEIAVADAGLTRGNIYRGVVASVQPSLDAAFVDYGAEKHGFISRDDIVSQAYHRQPPEEQRHPRVDRILERGKPIVVQVTKDPAGTKGAALTTNVSLAGRYLVLMPFDDVRGISRKVEDEGLRKQIRDLVDRIAVPEGFGFIVRTAALDQTKAVLNRDLNALTRLWKRIRAEGQAGKGPRLLYSDQDLIVQAVRDLLHSSIDEVVVDDEEAYETVRAAMRAFMPRTRTKLVHYKDRLPLFSRYHLESQIEAIFQRVVALPSGGSIVIEGTEALTAVDVNSGRATKAGSQEETAHAINLEAAREVARQLRLRDIGGLIVVDFIDMRQRRHQQAVEKALKEAVKADRARIAVGRISPNGLLEINRQRLKTPLVMRTHRMCPTCGGGGRIASPETVSMSLLRRIEERAAQGLIRGVRIRLHPELADAMQNHRRHEIAGLENEFDLSIEVIAATNMHRSEEEIEWVERRPREEPPPATPPLAAVRVSDLTSSGGKPEAVEREPRAEESEREPATVTERKSRRRRRGGRRRRKLGAALEPSDTTEATEAGVGEPQAPAPEPQPSADDGKVVEEEAASSKKRRRRRRPSRSRRGAKEKAATGAEE